MKTIITSILIFSSFEVHAQFHIKSEPTKFGHTVVYTGDNWKTKRELKSTYGRWLLPNKRSADSLAVKFKSFAICEAYNRKQYLIGSPIDPRVEGWKP